MQKRRNFILTPGDLPPGVTYQPLATYRGTERLAEPWPDCPACHGVGHVMATVLPFAPLERFACSCPKRPAEDL